jgi:hypothetical protein
MSAHALLLGIAASVAIGRVDVAGLAIAAAIGTLFVPLAAAISVMSHRAMRAGARRRTVALVALEAALGLAALLRGPAASLVGVGIAGAAIAGAYALARIRTGTRSVLTQLAAIAGISLLAPATWLLSAGTRGAWPLSAVAAFLSFGGTVPYVRERVRRRRTPGPTLGQRIGHGGVALGWQTVAMGVALAFWAAGRATVLLPIAFVPGLAKTMVGIVRSERKPPIAHIGYLETAVSTLFAVLAGIGMGLAA